MHIAIYVDGGLMMARLLVFASVLSQLFSGSVAMAGGLPSDADLKSAYCIKVLQLEIAVFNEVLQGADEFVNEYRNSPNSHHKALVASIAKVQQDRRNDISALNRLQLYLVPRMGHLDADGLLIASRRGEVDFELRTGANRQCGTKCLDMTNPEACLSSCLDQHTELIKRVVSCRTPTWLPF
jgi:hypothetical protein